MLGLYNFNGSGYNCNFVADHEIVINLIGKEIVLYDDGDENLITHWVSNSDIKLLTNDDNLISSINDFKLLSPNNFDILTANIRDNEGFDATID